MTGYDILGIMFMKWYPRKSKGISLNLQITSNNCICNKTSKIPNNIICYFLIRNFKGLHKRDSLSLELFDLLYFRRQILESHLLLLQIDI